MKKFFIISFSIFFILSINNLSFSKTFTWNKIDAVSISLPDDWEQEKELDTFLNEILKFRHKVYKNFLIILTYKKLINYDSSRHMADFDAGVLKKKGYIIIENTPREIYRLPAYEYIYKYRDTLYKTFDKENFYLRKIYLVIGKKYYSFKFSCPAVYFREYQKILRRIIDNFIILIKTDENAGPLKNK